MVRGVLDSILGQITCSVAPARGKKQKKSVKSKDPDQCDDATNKRENALCLLSALLDVLLMKKNIDNRSVVLLCIFKICVGMILFLYDHVVSPLLSKLTISYHSL